MPAKVRWHLEAVADLERAVEWYASQEDGARLVARFERAVTRELEHVARAPERWPVVRRAYRQKVFTSAFPYVLVYRITDGAVFVVAVAHEKRHPSHWAGR